jgi:Concanavalin A-like lectin/glucanases superfamily
LTATNGDGFSVQFAADSLPLETGFGKTDLPVKLIRSIKVTPPMLNAAAPVATGEAGSRLTIELRDGSHIVGKGLDDTLDFHSPAMGDLKLGWAGIRSLEYATINTDTARLTATNGDVYEVQFAASAVRVETSFGKNELPVKLIRSIKVSTMTSPGQLPSDLVALWSGEGNANDSVGGNNGQLLNGAGFATGKIGQAFAFHSIGDQVTASATDLPVGTSDRTIDCWIYIDEALGSDGDGFIAGYGKGESGQIYALDVSHGQRLLFTQWGKGIFGPALEVNRWYNIAVTSVGTNSINLYVDGINVATGALNFNTPAGGPVLDWKNQFTLYLRAIQRPYLRGRRLQPRTFGFGNSGHLLESKTTVSL